MTSLFGGRFRFLIFAWLFYFAQLSGAQKCPSTEVNEQSLESALQRIGLENTYYFENDTENTGIADEIYRLSAIGGRRLIPALRRLSKPGMPIDSVPGAAEVSLAKIGDVKALEQILDDLKRENYDTPAAEVRMQTQALSKLGRIGNEQAASILINHYLSHISKVTSESMPVSADDEGITSSDWLLTGLRALAPYMINPPPQFNFDPQVWTEWCHENKDSLVTWNLNAPSALSLRQACLIRKISWGFPDAILDLAAKNDKGVIPILKELANIRDKEARTSPFNSTLRGKAQTALAKLGDSNELNAIIKEFNTPNYALALPKLEFIGGEKTAQALIDGLEADSVFANLSEVQLIEKKKQRYDLIVATLRKIILIPPEVSYTFDDKGKWIAWWAKNKNTARFVQQSGKTYE